MVKNYGEKRLIICIGVFSANLSLKFATMPHNNVLFKCPANSIISLHRVMLWNNFFAAFLCSEWQMAHCVGAILKWTGPTEHIWLDFISGS